MNLILLSLLLGCYEWFLSVRPRPQEWGLNSSDSSDFDIFRSLWDPCGVRVGSVWDLGHRFNQYEGIKPQEAVPSHLSEWPLYKAYK